MALCRQVSLEATTSQSGPESERSTMLSEHASSNSRDSLPMVRLLASSTVKIASTRFPEGVMSISALSYEPNSVEDEPSSDPTISVAFVHEPVELIPARRKCRPSAPASIPPSWDSPWVLIRTSTLPSALTPMPCSSMWLDDSVFTVVAHAKSPVEFSLTTTGL